MSWPLIYATAGLLLNFTRPDLRRYDEVFRSASHNSYWVGRVPEIEGSGTGERILDQLVSDQVGAIELDIHVDPQHVGVWAVYHTSERRNSLCTPLAECLKQLQLFHHLHPQHDVVNVVIELKELWSRAFDAHHTVQQFDETLRAYLGPWLYTPGDFLCRCDGRTALRDCAAAIGWPTMESLRGRFIVNLIGNWNLTRYDWANYATTDLASRVAFPLRTISRSRGVVKRLLRALSPATTAADERRVHEAEENAIFWQVEYLDYPGVAEFLKHHGVARSKSAQTEVDQLDRLGRGLQLIQNDVPWSCFANLRRFGPRVAVDKWREIELLGQVAQPVVVPLADVLGAADGRLEVATFPSLSRFDGAAVSRQGHACLVATSAEGKLRFQLCRRVLDDERVRIEVEARSDHQHENFRETFDSPLSSAGFVGDLIALQVIPHAGGSCVVAKSAAEMAGPKPLWHQLSVHCFMDSVVEIAATATAKALFVGTRVNGEPLQGHRR